VLPSPAPRVRNFWISLAIAAAVLVRHGTFTDAAQDVAAASCAIETTERVVAIA